MNGAQDEYTQEYQAGPDQETGRTQASYPGRSSRMRRDSGLPYKSPALATILSMFPGLGQVYLGYVRQGFQNMVIFASVVMALARHIFNGLEPLLGIFLAFFFFYNLIDANRRANSINNALDGIGDESLPQDYELPGSKGSVPTGLLLIVIGILFILDLNFNVSMSWLEDWWPLGLIGLGGWLIFKARTQAE